MIVVRSGSYIAKGDKKKVETAIDYQGRLAQDNLNNINQQLGYNSNQASNYMYGGNPYQQQSGSNAGSGGSSSMTNDQINDYIEQRQQELPATAESLEQIVNELNEQGVPVRFATRGQGLRSDDKLVYPDGTMNDFISDVGGENAGWTNHYVEGGPGYVEGQNQQGGAAGMAMGDYHNLMNQYQDWANTGGYSPEDLANIRSRSTSPIRSAYSSARENLERTQALQGGYMPNRGAAEARMAREQGQLMSDANRATEAGIAEMTNQGRRFGMQGMSSTFGTTPGLANMFGNQALAATGQRLQGQGLQNQLGLGLIGAQQNATSVPGNFQQAMGNIGSGLQMAGNVGSLVYPWL